MNLTLGDAFSRRKQVESEITNWNNRLAIAGRISTIFKTKKIVGNEKFEPLPGSIQKYDRHYTIEECRTNLDKLIAEDKDLALRISKTNQLAKSKLKDLSGEEVELSIPELLVLKNDIAPKIEASLRNVPIRATGVDVIKEEKDHIVYRTITEILKSVQEMGEKGQVITNNIIEYYKVTDNIDYGLNQRDIYNEIDKVHEWMHRLKEAINQANKTELVILN